MRGTFPNSVIDIFYSLIDDTMCMRCHNICFITICSQKADIYRTEGLLRITFSGWLMTHCHYACRDASAPGAYCVGPAAVLGLYGSLRCAAGLTCRQVPHFHTIGTMSIDYVSLTD